MKNDIKIAQHIGLPNDELYLMENVKPRCLAMSVPVPS